MDRLFVAALADDATLDELTRLERDDEPGVRWVPAENWHVTLRFLGRCEPSTIVDRLAGASLPRCRATLGPTIEWLGSQLVVPVHGIEALAAAVTSATNDVGEPAGRPFRGHLTIARTRRGATSTAAGQPVRGGFDVEEIVLMRSDLAPSGARYSKIARFTTR